MQLYVINLRSATDRLAHVNTTLQAAKIAWQRFDAHDPERARAHPLFSTIPKTGEIALTPGEAACFLSHHDIWRRIAEGDDPYGAVMEDDLFVDARLKPLLDGDIRIPSNADIVKLETTGCEITVSTMRHRRRNGLSFRRLRSLHYGTGAYVISRAAASRLIDLTSHFDTTIDNALFSPDHVIGSSLIRYQLIPALAIQNVVRLDAAQRPDLLSRLEFERTAERGENIANWRRALRSAPPPPPAPRTVGCWTRKCLRALKDKLVETSGIVPFSDVEIDSISRPAAVFQNERQSRRAKIFR